MNRFARHRYCIAALLLGTGLLTAGVTSPWERYDGYGGVWASACARNYIRYGLVQTRGLCVRNNEPVLPDEYTYYIHHPVGVPLTIAASFVVFGERESAARVVPIAFALGSIVLIYALGRFLFGRRVGVLAAVVLAVIPMAVLVGSQVGHEAPTGFFVLLLVYCYARWQASSHGRWQLAMAATFIIGAQFGWPIYYLGGVLPLDAFLRNRSLASIGRVMWMPALGVLLFAAFLLHLQLALGDQALAGMKAAFSYRAGDGDAYFDDDALKSSRFVRSQEGSVSEIHPRYRHLPSWRRQVRAIGGWITILNTLPILLLAGMWALQFIHSLTVRHRRRDRDDIIAILFAVGAIHILLFRHGASHHYYWPYYLTFGFALAAARGTWLSIALIRPSRFTRGFKSFAQRSILALLILLVASANYTTRYTSARVRRIVEPLNADLCTFGKTIAKMNLPPGAVAINLEPLGTHVSYYAQRKIRYRSELGAPPDSADWFEHENIVMFALAQDQSDGDAWGRLLAHASMIGQVNVRNHALQLFRIPRDRF